MGGEDEYLTPVTVMVLGSSAGLLLILIIVILAVRVRRARRANISRDTSKVVVTTITDLEFDDNLSSDRLPLGPSISGDSPLSNSNNQLLNPLLYHFIIKVFN